LVSKSDYRKKIITSQLAQGERKKRRSIKQFRVAKTPQREQTYFRKISPRAASEPMLKEALIKIVRIKA